MNAGKSAPFSAEYRRLRSVDNANNARAQGP